MKKNFYIQPATECVNAIPQSMICIGSPIIDNTPVSDQWGDAPTRRVDYLRI